MLFGQTADIFGPAVASTVDFRQGATFGTPNNPRVAQLRVTQKVNLGADNSLKLVAGLQNPVEDVTTPGAEGSIPNVAAQIMFISKALGTAPGFYGLAMNSLQADGIHAGSIRRSNPTNSASSAASPNRGTRARLITC